MKNNPKAFKAIANVVVEKLANYLSKSQAGQGKVLVQKSIAELAELMQLINRGGSPT